jgi:hypothetical protein
MISSDKIGIVTGTPRSGTSLMMQTLLLMQIPIAGDRMPTANRRIDSFIKNNNLSLEEINRILEPLQIDLLTALLQEELPTGLEKFKSLSDNFKDIAKLNPKGFYEITGVVGSGIKEVGDYGGQFLKIVIPGVSQTETAIIDKIIACVRNPIHVAKSQTDLRTGIAIANTDEWDNLKPDFSLMQYIAGMNVFCNWSIKKNLLDKICVVDYDEFVSNSEKTIQRIISFLDCEPSAESIQKAINNVDNKLRRSPFKDIENTATSEEEILANTFYSAIKTSQESEMTEAVNKALTFIDTQNREHIAFYDDNTNRMITPEFRRRFLSDDKFREETTKDYVKLAKQGFIPKFVKGYREINDKYILRLPQDLGGDVETNLVEYQGKQMTKEECYSSNLTARQKNLVILDEDKIKELKIQL